MTATPSGTTYGWKITGTDNPVEMMFFDCSEHFVETAYYVDPTCTLEGLSILDGDCVGVSVGLDFKRNSSGIEPWLKVRAKHMNVSRIGIDLQNIVQFMIMETLVYAQSSQNSADLTGDWIGMKLYDNAASYTKGRGKIIDCTITRLSSWTGTTYGIKLDSTRGDLSLKIRDNHVNDFDIGTYEGPGVSGVNFSDNDYTNCTTNHVDT